MRRASPLLVLFAVACGDVAVSPKARAEADVIWADRCANCHGPKGLGDGPGARVLPVRPRVLSDSAWQASVSDDHIATVITEGGQVVGLDANMAANPDLKAKPDVLRALVLKVRSLKP
ncbi:MAG: c-type cytochrome [Nannocystaceae bacterium]|nr:cytochrome c [bacterium]